MIRRPLCFIVSAFAGGILLRHLCGRALVAGVAAGLCMAALCVLLTARAVTPGTKTPENRLQAGMKKQEHAIRIAAAAAALAGVLVMQCAAAGAADDPYVQQNGKTVQIHGMVTSCEQKLTEEAEPAGWRMVILTEDGSRLLADYAGELPPGAPEGCAVSGTGTVSLPSGARNPGCFDYALHLKGRRIYARIRLEKAEVGPVKSRWRHFFACRRAALLEALEPYLNEEQAAVLAAMLFGDKSMLPEDTYTAFQRNGTAHVLAVSGLHVGMLYGLYAWLAGRKRTPVSCLILAGLLFSYAALAGFSPSVVRAGVMIGIHTFGRLLHARYDMLTGAALSAGLILAVSPYQLFAGGFQLSFLAVLLLACLQPLCEKRWLPTLLAAGRRRGLPQEAVSAAAAAGRWLIPVFLLQAGMMPLTAYLFNYVSAGSFFANLPLVLIAGLIVPAGILLLFLLLLPCGAFFFPLGGHLVAFLTGKLLLWNRLSYLDDALSFDAVSPPRWCLFVFYGVVFLLMSEWGQIRFSRKEWRRAGIAVLLVCCSGLLCACALSDGFEKADVVFVDVGQGDCVHIRCGEGADLLFDGGGREDYDVGRKTVKPYLLKNRVRTVDAAFVTHLDTDHYGGIVSLCQEGMVRRLVVYEGHAADVPQIVRETGLPADRIILAGPEDTFRFGKVTVFCAGPLSAGGTENEQSLVLLAEKDGRRLLITGDIGTETEEKMAVFYHGGELRAEILQIPHHGSRYSSSQALISAAAPAAAVAQTGYNHYGHPAEEVLKRYEDNGVRVFRNDLDGAVGIDLKNMRVVTMIER